MYSYALTLDAWVYMQPTHSLWMSECCQMAEQVSVNGYRLMPLEPARFSKLDINKTTCS
jgi:hypothetical protein